MLTEHSLEELQKLAMPALRHGELIELARTENPNRILEAARRCSWPLRQARAARYLALIRRDFTLEAFEAFVSTMERIRSERSETEQAQEKKRMDARIQAALARVSHPQQKLEVMLRHDLTGEVDMYIDSFVANHHCYFWLNTGNGTRFDGPLFGDHRKVQRGDPQASPVALVLICREKSGAEPLEFGNNPLSKKPELAFGYELMAERLHWSAEHTSEVARIAIGNIVGQDARGTKYWALRGSVVAARAYLHPDDPLQNKVIVWDIMSCFREGRIFELRERFLAGQIVPSNATDERQELDPVVDYLVSLGMPEDEFRQEILAAAGDEIHQKNPRTVLALLGCKLLNRYGPEQLKVQNLLRMYIPNIWKAICNGSESNWAAVEKLLELGDLRSLRTVHELDQFADDLVGMVSVGEVARAYQIMVHFGASFIYRDRATVLDPAKEAQKRVSGMVAKAFGTAYGGERYGVAAALLQQFGPEACFGSIELYDASANAPFLAEVIQALPYVDDADPDSVHAYLRGTFQHEDPEVEAKLGGIRLQRNNRHEELMKERERQIAEVTQLALDLGQPIRLDPFTYLPIPPKYRSAI